MYYTGTLATGELDFVTQKSFKGGDCVVQLECVTVCCVFVLHSVFVVYSVLVCYIVLVCLNVTLLVCHCYCVSVL